MQDTAYVATVAGTLGALARPAVNLILCLPGIAKTTILHAAAAMILTGLR
ncbi:MAG: hypothetical protein AB1426_10830 [Bacillota bacterium]